jgi:MGT family glycosyltransferase
MSTVLFFNIPAHGHTNPTLPVVKELAGRGEEITYYSSDTFSKKICAAGARPALHSFSFIRAMVRMWIDGFSGTARWFRAARALRRQFGVNTYGLNDVFTNREDLNIVYTSRLFQPGERAFDEERFTFVGPSIAPRNDPFDLPVAKTEKRPILYVSLGTIVSDLESFYRTCFEAYRDEDLLVIMSVGGQIDIARLGQIPDNVIVRNRVPQLEVLRRAGAFLTHAGMNSVSEGLLAGVPLVCFPQTAEQAMVAKQVVQCGAGKRMHPRDITADVLRAYVREVLANASYKQSAAKLSESFAAGGGYVHAADEIFAFKKRRGIR